MFKKHLIIDSRPYGLFSIFLHTLDCLKWCEDNEYVPYVRWSSGRININLGREGAEEASYRGNPVFVKDKNNFSTELKRNNNTKMCLYATDENDNVWNYYFEPIQDFNIDEILKSEYKINDIFMCGNLDFDLENKFLIKNIHSYDSLKLWNITDLDAEKKHRQEVYKLITKYVKIKSEIIKKVENFSNTRMIHSGVNIGVHVRGTDKKTEYPFKQLTIEHYIQKISEIIKDNLNKEYKIYIASDNNEAIIKIANHFGKNNIIAYPSSRVNDFYGSIPICLLDTIDRKKHGEETLIEMLLLSKCDYIVGTDSNFTATACYFNPESKFFFLNRNSGHNS